MSVLDNLKAIQQNALEEIKMIKSMTGYGLATTEYENKKINVEIRSLNSKFLELLVKLPKIYNDKENVLRTICGKQIERGKASVILVIENTIQK